MKASLTDLQFECPSCGETIEADADMAGTKGKCPQCKARIIVPKRCPECCDLIPATAQKCFHCGEFVDGRRGSFGNRRISKTAVVVLIILAAAGWGAYEYTIQKEWEASLKNRMEAKRKMDDYRLKAMAAGRYEAPVRVQVVPSE